MSEFELKIESQPLFVVNVLPTADPSLDSSFSLSVDTSALNIFTLTIGGTASSNGGTSVEAIEWDNITEKPTFATVAMSGSYSDLTELPMFGSAASAEISDFATAEQGELAASALQPGTIIPWINVSNKPAFFSGIYGNLTDIPETFAPSAHNQAWGTITDTPTTLAGYGISDAATTEQGLLATSASQPGHIHAQGDVTGLQTALDDKQPLATVLSNTTAAFTTAQETKLAGIATEATANATDAALRDRSSHTGTQAITTVTGLQTALDNKQVAGNYATAAQGVKADTAVQPAALTAKQDTLVSGTNIKTVGGVSLLGSGDVPSSGGSPGGTTGQMQYNNAGAFGGAANVGIEGGNLRLAATDDPAPPTGAILFYSKYIAGLRLPRFIGEAGIPSTLQTALHDEAIVSIMPTSTTGAPSIMGGTLTTIATMSLQQTIGSSNLWLSTERKRFATTTTAGNASGMRFAYTKWFRGSAPGFGGVWFRGQFGLGSNLNGGQVFIGICASTGALAGEPSALLNMFGIGYDSTDANTDNWKFMRNDGSGVATQVDLGANAARNTTNGFDLIMFLPPGEAKLFVRIVNINTGATVLDASYTTDLPAANTGLSFKCDVRNGTVAAQDSIDFANVYIGRRP